VYKEYASKDYTQELVYQALKDTQSDYNQNNSTEPDYIKNRPFYAENEYWPEIVLDEQQIEINTDGSGVLTESISFCNPVGLDNDYSIIIDEDAPIISKFNSIYIGDMKYLYLGNGHLANSDITDTGDPIFIAADITGRIALIISDPTIINEGTHTLSIKYAPAFNDTILLFQDTLEVLEENKQMSLEQILGYKASEGDRLSYKINDNDPITVTLEKSLIENNTDGLFAGNFGLDPTNALLGYSDTGEDYLILTNINENSFTLIFRNSGTYDISLSLIPKEIVHKLDNKFLSDDILNLPFTLDANGNIVIEKDLYFEGMNSVKTLKETIESLTERIKVLEEQQSTVMADYAEAAELLGGLE